MVTITDELKWESDMVDAGVAKYHAAIDAARFRDIGKNNADAKDESSTSYGVSMMREYFQRYEDTINAFLDVAANARHKPTIVVQYLLACDVRTVAYIAAKCIIDTISKEESQTALIFRISGRIEDQMRMIRFSEDYESYYKALTKDMKHRGIKDYRRKRKVLVHCHDKAVVADEKDVWIAWPTTEKIHLGRALIDLFMQATGEWDNVNNCLHPGSGLIERVTKRTGNKTAHFIKGTELAFDIIQTNMELFQYLHPEFMPTLLPPLDWTTPWNGGFHHPDLRRRRPLVKVKGFSRKAHSKALNEADMPSVYDGINTLQQTAWRVNEFVLEQAKAELKAQGIGCPVGMNTPAPESPHPLPERGDMTDAQYENLLSAIRATRTPDENEELKNWRAAMRDWHHRQIQNKAKMLGLYNTYKIANLLKAKDKFYYVYTMDSRGRAYPCGVHLHPQGTDMAKGLLEFAEGTPLGPFGYWHLCIHAAGVYGIDKVSLEDRIAWIHEHQKNIMDTWQDPASTRDFWGSADKPYLFLAACKELAEIWMQYGTKMLTIVNKKGLQGVAAEYINHCPCAQDGSCNGIQHFSAMLRDPVGAKAVNMTASGKVEDIYGQTAALAEKNMRKDIEEGMLTAGKQRNPATEKELYFMRTWVNLLKIDRKVAKRSTMIIPYGGQKSSCKADVGDVLAEKLEKLHREGKGLDWSSYDAYQAAWIMHNYVWAALDVVVVAARKAMKFLSKAATVQNRTGIPLQWTAPSGFPAFQDYKETKTKTVNTFLSGRMQIHYHEPTDDLDANRMRNAFPPNYVHSMDAAHLMLTVCAAADLGISNFAAVHDSYGVPAGHCEAFHKIIRQEFIKIYENEPLQRLYFEQQALNPGRADEYPPLTLVEPGKYDIQEVINAEYFFR